jgi:tRNA (guanine-N7-)-methyltransferase
MKSAAYLKYLYDPCDDESYPVDWEKVFGRKTPLAVEVGCGNGAFLQNWAISQPQWNFIGIEISMQSVEHSLIRLFNRELGQARIIREDARFSLKEFFADNSVAHLIMNFPDPWPKKRHARRRLLNVDFVKILAAIIKQGGIYELVTDQEWYAEDTFYLFEKSGKFRCESIIKNPERSVQTKYEKKWKAEKREIYQFTAVKEKSATLRRILETSEMPHFIILKQIDPEKVFSLKGLTQKRNETVFAVKEVFCDRDRRSFILRMVTADGDYTQNFHILVAPHSRGSIVKLDAGIQPYRTPGVKWAVREIGQFLEETESG